ncbi:MAG: hypothetical protein IJL38_01765 [Bacteroidales bacterium]|nr:hypothetical protein [Bacteroidales bacterium]
MYYTDEYLSRLTSAELIDKIKKTSSDFYDNIGKIIVSKNQVNGLLLGNVQSGKTAQMLGLISKMADEGYRLFLLLTTDNVDLHRQTFNRVKQSLPSFNVLSERDEIEFAKAKLSKPLVIVLKKNSRVLRKWKNTLVNANICHGLYLAILDDEADNASLNTMVNSNRVSTINKHIQSIKDTATKTVYIEVTATPQAIILQSNRSNWKPDFVTYFEPGLSYLGGNYFYSEPTSFCIRFTSEYELDEVISDDDIFCPVGLRTSVAAFLVNCAEKKLNGEYNCNFLIHPSSRIDIHTKFTKTVQDYLNLLQNTTEEPEFHDIIFEAWKDLQSTKPDINHFEDIKETVIQILNNTELFVFSLNSKNTEIRDSSNPDALDLSKGFNIIVGGNTLGRGITFPHLQVVYYCRSSRTPQADTYWQHSRIFGYDREGGVVRIFIPPHLYRLFSRLNRANDILIKEITSGLKNLQVIYPQGINPTRRNVIDNNLINIVYGGVNIFESLPLGINTETIDSLINCYADSYSEQVDADLVIRLLELTPSQTIEDFDTQKYIACIKSLIQSRPTVTIRLIVRTERNIAKGTGTLLSQNDRELGERFSKDVVLTMYRLTGAIEKGWSGSPLWIPNIKFPEDCVFYDTKPNYSTS